jgi:RNA polymerase sigma factor (TIGR02999 family)
VVAEREQVTEVLAAMARGEADAAERLLPLVYSELKVLARARMARERPGQTLQPTALVHEAYLRLVGEGARWENRAHFYGAAAQVMRRIMVERARRVSRLKRGGDAERITLHDDAVSVAPRSDELLALDEALDRLAAHDRGMADVVMLRYFAGLTVTETAEAVGASERTVSRQWTAARAWLRHQLTGPGRVAEKHRAG